MARMAFPCFVCVPVWPDVILGPEFDRDVQTQLDSDYILLGAGDYVTVGFDELVIDQDGDDLFIITPLFGGTFDDNGESAEVSVTTDGINFTVVATVGLAAFVGIDLADAGVADPVLGVRITGVGTGDAFALTGVQASPGEFRTTRFVYNENGNLTETIDALGNSSFQTNDEFGRPTSFTDRRGNTTTPVSYTHLTLPTICSV